MGQFLGEEVHVRDARHRAPGSRGAARRRRHDVTCPGRERTNDGRAGFEGTYKDAAPVDIRLGLLRVGDVMIGAVNAEVFNPIAQRLKRESPFKATMMTTLTNGSARSGYIPDDERTAIHRSKCCRRGSSPDVPRRPSSRAFSV